MNKLGEILFIFQNSPYVMEKEFGPEVTHNKYETYFQGWQLIGDDVDDRDPNCQNMCRTCFLPLKMLGVKCVNLNNFEDVN